MDDAAVTAGPSYTIIGTGALGGYYGARLHHAGADVGFLLNTDYEHVREHGLTVESVDGDFSIERPRIYAGTDTLEPADVALVCLKTTHNHLLPELLPAASRPDGVVVVMQNGLFMEDLAAAAVPGRTVLGAMAFLCSNKVGPGHIRHLDYGGIRVGQYSAEGRPAGLTAAVRSVGAVFGRAGIHVDLEADLLTARWKKLVWNVPYNGMCVVHDTTTDVLMNAPEMRARCESIMYEVTVAAAACGRPVDPSFVEEMMTTTDRMASYKPSMLLDYRAGRPMEVEAIYGNPLRAAEAAGASCPLIRELYEQLCELGRRSP
ncbi:MAG: putative 2-dehydropantoate 2-reductase [Myxococcales bacterium]|nr:MAG: putative 2-dehydropantoate 2-reductase [Myxococcales bacterium]